jgi:XTP/dITP diphosphohydrolase
MDQPRLVIATNNPGKVVEFRDLLEGCGWEVLASADIGVSIEVDETGATYAENARLKAQAFCRASGLPAIADDSGLEVDALRGAPGIYSARYAGVGAGDEANLKKLLEELKAVPGAERTARFQCLMVFMEHGMDPTPIICQGSWEGRITEAPAGENGFGYDPVFYVPSHDCTAAQLSAEEKNRLSHRGQALQLLMQALR